MRPAAGGGRWGRGPARTGLCLLLLAVMAASRTQAEGPAPRNVVRLLVRQADRADNELAVLARAELLSAGFQVEQRLLPDGAGSLGEPVSDRVLALVELGGPAEAQVTLFAATGAARAPSLLVEPVHAGE